MADYLNGNYFSELEYRSKTIYLYPFGTTDPPVPLDELQNFFPDDEHIGIDTAYSTGIVFYYPSQIGATDTVTLESQWLPIHAQASMNQTILQSGSGVPSIYDSGFKDRIISVNIKNIPMEKIERLYIFMVNIAKGALNRFQYLDESGTLYTVRWWDKIFPRDMLWWLKHEISLNMRVEDIDE